MDAGRIGLMELDQEQPNDLEQLLDRIASAAEKFDEVSLGAIVEEVGPRSFGPLLLMAGLIVASPLTGIPALPTAMSVLVVLVAAQLFLQRDHFWLPQWLLRRSIKQQRLNRAVRWLRPPARHIDHWANPRPKMAFLFHRPGRYAIALVCIAIAASMPLLELVPFSSSIAGLALATYGLALIAYDGRIALAGFLFTGVTVWLLVHGADQLA